MAERILASANEAVALGALQAGCQAFFGYPITPQSEILEFMSQEMPRRGLVFIQCEDELAAINMVCGSAMAGARALTSSSSTAISLMQEGISYMSSLHLPGVVVNVSRQGPGQGGAYGAQVDYRQSTKGGGHGGYRCIVLAPASSQETFDLMQLAFYLADKWRVVVLVLLDGFAAHTSEPVELHTLEFGPLPPKDDWALMGRAKRGRPAIPFMLPQQYTYVDFHMALARKYQQIEQTEVRYETYQAENARVLLVGYGSAARAAKGAVDMARARGMEVGLFRPITLWPFPGEGMRAVASRAHRILAVEDSAGQLVEDVAVAVEDKSRVHLLGMWARHTPLSSGRIFPERILQEVEALYD